MRRIQAAVITVSDQGYAGKRTDESGPAARDVLEQAGIEVREVRILPDEQQMLADTMRKLCDSGELDLLFTSGGTGMAPRDVTPEATAQVIERAAPGIAEAMRAKSLAVTDRAMLSRAVAGVRGKTLIVNLPGSPRAVRECLEAVLPALGHAAETLRGEAFECAQEQSGGHAHPQKPTPPVLSALNHLDERGNARMVDVGDKEVTDRVATARAVVRMQPQTLERILTGGIAKGDVFSCARIAGIMAAKRTHELIPMCHPLPITSVKLELTPLPPDRVQIDATVGCSWCTGVEMEALTAASIAGLTVYDMCKAIDRGMAVEQVQLVYKAGGRSGEYTAPELTQTGKGNGSDG